MRSGSGEPEMSRRSPRPIQVPAPRATGNEPEWERWPTTMAPGGGGLAGEVLVSSRDGGRSWSDAQLVGENSRMNRKDSATSATVVSARSRGRARRHHQDELWHEGADGAGNVGFGLLYSANWSPV